MTEFERMINGLLYNANNDELNEKRVKRCELLKKFNDEANIDIFEKQNYLRKLFKKFGKNTIINPPFRCDYGENISIGDNCFLNFDCVLLDVNEIIIGNNVLIGPRVSVLTPSHPIDMDVRALNLELGKKIIINDFVWIGGGAILNPGVEIGKGSIIGSGSVVTKSIPENVIAAGNPCRIIRKIDENDKNLWNKLKDDYFRGL